MLRFVTSASSGSLGPVDVRRRPRPIRQVLLWIVVTAIVLSLVLGILFALPRWVVDDNDFHATRSRQDPTVIEERRLKARNDARVAGAQMGAVLAVLVGAALTVRSLRLTREGQITDRYAKAIEQLGAWANEVQLGGIYALERIARDSERDHERVMELLLGHLRGHVRAASQGVASGPPRQPANVVQAVVDVLAARKGWRERRPLELIGLDLRNVDFSGARLRGANLSGSDLSGAQLQGCDLRDTTLVSTGFRNAHLDQVKLGGADLARADMSGAWVAGANFKGVKRTDLATFEGLRGADRAKHLPRSARQDRLQPPRE